MKKILGYIVTEGNRIGYHLVNNSCKYNTWKIVGSFNKQGILTSYDFVWFNKELEDKKSYRGKKVFKKDVSSLLDYLRNEYNY